MNDVIHLLPDSVANQIAAGEVIQRPASVIKELVENAVDAGATEVNVIVKDAGRTLIQVVDNGKGMSETDARMAFERHATSKISDAEDLFTLRTMGFRGEALPSICAISQVELRTSTGQQAVGTRLVINGSRVESQEPCVCDRGSNFMVRNIFYNVPARRKFLKSDNVELANIMREFERLALVNNDVRMSIDTGTRRVDLRAGSFRQRILDIWKNSLNPQLIPVDVETSLVKIHGFVSRPEQSRRRNALQFLIVNGRNMRHPGFHKAVMSCFEGLIAADTQPCYFMKFEVDPATIDVNISPTKNEIKFEHELQIWPILQAAVKAALGKNSAVPSIDFTSEPVSVDPLKLERGYTPDLGLSAGYNPFMSSSEVQERQGGGRSSRVADSWRPTRVSSDWEKLYSGFVEARKEEHIASPSRQEESLPLEADDRGEVGPICMQYAGRYIITGSREGLLIIDQHRAHVKVLYEKYMRRMLPGETASQGVMFPETLELDEAQIAALEEVEPELARIGFVLEYEEENRWRIIGVPAVVRSADAKDIVLRILDSVSEDSRNYGKEHPDGDFLMKQVALTMARSGAVTRGTRLSAGEMEHLVGELFSLPDPGRTPNGNPVFCRLDDERLSSLFR